MAKPHRNPVSDIRGASRLAIDAIAGITGLVEAMHTHIAKAPTKLGGPIVSGAVNGTASAVYKSIRGVTRMVGGGIDLALGALAPAVGELEPAPAREAVVAALNGVLGDHLEATHNPLAIQMRLRRNGRPLTLTREALAAAIPNESAKVVVLVHGLCMNDLGWERDGHDHGAALARDLGYTPVYLHYNTGLHISLNGRAFADELEALVAAWPRPLEDLTIVAHSMGGLVARSACSYAGEAGHAWPTRLRKLVFLGTPHHGAPLERGGHWLDLLLDKSPYTAPFSRLGKVRSAGITDLRHGALRDEDWQGHDRFARRADPRMPVPLPAGVACYAIAATVSDAHAPLRDRLVGDGLVPVPSALGEHADPRFALVFAEAHRWIAYDAGHLDLLSSEAVYAKLRDWLAG
ncbi:MAG: GPI inositol-deacylase [Burkholderiales bacterium]|jgi:hypothetical protein|nr:GPI inositol-deacylase [Burkholderiales bacterium]